MEKTNNETNYDFKEEVKEIKDYTQLTNYYFDTSNALRPYTFSMPANIETLPPTNALREAPEIMQGVYPCEQNGKWVQIADHRGKTIYSKETAEASEVTELGEIADTHTLIKPEFEHPKWKNGKWYEDVQAVNEQKIAQNKVLKEQYIKEATAQIQQLNDRFELGREKDGDKEKLKAWKIFRIDVSDVDTSDVNVKFPDKPVD